MQMNYKLYKGFWVCKAYPHMESPIDRETAAKILSGGGVFSEEYL